MVFALVFARGCRPRDRQPGAPGFVIELVGPDRIVNAVALNSVVVHTAAHRRPGRRGRGDRAVRRRPVLPGQRAVFRARCCSRCGAWTRASSTPAEPAAAAPAATCGSALAYVRATPALWIPLAMMARGRDALLQLPGPAAAAGRLHLARHRDDLRDADRGDGRRLGARRAGRRRARPRRSRLLGRRAGAFGVFELLAAAAAPTLPLQVAALVPLGAVTVTFAAGVNSIAAARRRARRCAGA